MPTTCDRRAASLEYFGEGAFETPLGVRRAGAVPRCHVFETGSRDRSGRSRQDRCLPPVSPVRPPLPDSAHRKPGPLQLLVVAAGRDHDERHRAAGGGDSIRLVAIGHDESISRCIPISGMSCTGRRGRRRALQDRRLRYNQDPCCDF